MKFQSYTNEADKLMVEVRGFYEKMPSGYLVTDEIYSRFVEQMACLLSVSSYSLCHSGISLVGRPISYATYYKPVYFWNANKEAFRDGKIYPITGEHIEEQKAEFRFTKVEYIGVDFVGLSGQFLTGTAALRHARWRLSHRQAVAWCRRLGYRYDPNSKFVMPEADVAFPGMVAVLKLTHKEGKKSTNLDDFDIQVVEDASATTFNHATMNARSGLKPCPFGFEDRIRKFPNYCLSWCLKGWKSCPYASHKEDYVLGHCFNCGKDNQPLRHEGGMCLGCERSK